MYCSPPGFLSMGILQERFLEWVALPSSRGFSQPRDQTTSLTSPALASGFFTTSTTWGALQQVGNPLSYFKKPKLFGRLTNNKNENNYYCALLYRWWQLANLKIKLRVLQNSIRQYLQSTEIKTEYSIQSS